MNTTIQKFHDDHYGTAINKLSFNISHVTIIGKVYNIKTRCVAHQKIHMFTDYKSFYDYAECIYFQFSNQTKSEQYGSNSSFSKESIDLGHLKCQSNKHSYHISGEDILNNILCSLCLTSFIKMI